MNARRPSSWGAFVAALMTVAALGVATSAAAAPHPGYWLLGGDGGVFAFHAPFAGSAASNSTLCPVNTLDRHHGGGTCFAMAARPDAHGYWILDGDRLHVFAYGTAAYRGEPATKFVGQPRDFWPTGVAIVSTPSGNGYWVLMKGLSGLGTVSAFGDAKSYCDEMSTIIALPAGLGVPVALASTPDGGGYWITHSDGTVVPFGDAHGYGGMTAHHLVAPVVGMARNPAGTGYWLAASDGGVFSFGGAPFFGSMGGHHIDRPVFAIAATAHGT